MPIYEYKCSKCGNVFEVLQKFSDEPLTTHEGCGGKVEKLISASGFQLKGSGWYATDYAKSTSKPPAEAKSDSKSESKGESKSDSKSDSKSESKSEAKSESKPAETKSETPSKS